MAKLKITNSQDPVGIEIKRFYPPFSMTAACPGCGELVEWDHEYLSYPRLNEPEDVDFIHQCDGVCMEECDDDGCEGCWEEEWTERIVISITARKARPGE